MISVLFPTRNRPNSVRRVIETAQETSQFDNEFLAYVDEDDTSEQVPGVTYIQGPRIVLSQTFNELYKHANNNVIMFCSDDVAFRTNCWDLAVINSFPNDGIAFVHGDDGVNGDKFGTHGFLRREWIDTVGYVLPPYFSADYADNWINALADSIGRRIYIPYMFEHMHPSLGKAEVDQTFKETRERYALDRVAQKYDDLEAVRSADSDKLRRRLSENHSSDHNHIQSDVP